MSRVVRVFEVHDLGRRERAVERGRGDRGDGGFPRSKRFGAAHGRVHARAPDEFPRGERAVHGRGRRRRRRRGRRSRTEKSNERASADAGSIHDDAVRADAVRDDARHRFVHAGAEMASAHEPTTRRIAAADVLTARARAGG